MTLLRWALVVLSLCHMVSAEDWLARRAALVKQLLGTDGTLPNRSIPDFLETVPGPQMKGCMCSQQGNCNANQCVWSNNMTRIVWTIELPVNETYTIQLNSTVFHTLNTSGVAPGTGDGKEIVFPAPIPASRRSDVLVIHHHGHDSPHTYCTADWDGTTDWYNQLGYDVMTLQMPLLGCNWQQGYPGPEDHAWFKQWDDKGLPAMRFFLEPVVLTINYAREVLGYKHIVMSGLSGGGWTTTVAAALDSRIQLSLPVAGSIPCEFTHTSWDFEQWGACGVNGARKWPVNYTEMYALAALEPQRYSIQLIHEHDPCCFHGFGRHERIIAYNRWVQAQVEGHFETTPTVGNVHEVNLRDKTIIAMFLDKFRLKEGNLTESDFQTIPFNTLYEYTA